MKNVKTRIFAGAGGAPAREGIPLRGGLFRCMAGGDEWEALGAGLPQNAEVHVILVHPSDPDVVFVGTQDGPYRSTDGGDHWQRLGFPDRGVMIWALTLHPTRPNVMYAGAAPVALYRSLDGGETAALRANEDVKEFYLGLSATGRKNYRDVKHYRRRKRWLA